MDASEYHDNWMSDQADAIVMEGVDAAEVTVAGDISSLDINAFYNRYMAYSVELLSSASDESSAAPSSEPSAEPSSEPSAEP